VRDVNFILTGVMKRKALQQPFYHDDDDVRKRYYEFFTRHQTGSGMPVFAGRRHQRGHGISNILGGLLCRLVGFLGGHGADFLKQNREAAVSNLIKTGINVVKDVSSGIQVKETLKTRIPEGIKQTARELKFQSDDQQPSQQQQVLQKRQQAIVKPPKSRRGPKVRYLKRKDIFS